jgi:hypothetical protein
VRPQLRHLRAVAEAAPTNLERALGVRETAGVLVHDGDVVEHDRGDQVIVAEATLVENERLFVYAKRRRERGAINSVAANSLTIASS